jgi:hypothetical protein
MMNDFAQISDILLGASGDLLERALKMEDEKASRYARTAAVLVTMINDKISQERLDPASIPPAWNGLSVAGMPSDRSFWLRHFLDVANLNRTMLFELGAVSENTLLGWINGRKRWNNPSWRISTAAVILTAIQLRLGAKFAAQYKRLIALVFELDALDFHIIEVEDFAERLKHAKRDLNPGQRLGRGERTPASSSRRPLRYMLKPSKVPSASAKESTATRTRKPNSTKAI